MVFYITTVRIRGWEELGFMVLEPSGRGGRYRQKLVYTLVASNSFAEGAYTPRDTEQTRCIRTHDNTASGMSVCTAQPRYESIVYRFALSPHSLCCTERAQMMSTNVVRDFQ